MKTMLQPIHLISNFVLFGSLFAIGCTKQALSMRPEEETQSIVIADMGLSNEQYAQDVEETKARGQCLQEAAAENNLDKIKKILKVNLRAGRPPYVNKETIEVLREDATTAGGLNTHKYIDLVQKHVEALYIQEDVLEIAEQRTTCNECKEFLAVARLQVTFAKAAGKAVIVARISIMPSNSITLIASASSYVCARALKHDYIYPSAYENAKANVYTCADTCVTALTAYLSIFVRYSEKRNLLTEDVSDFKEKKIDQLLKERFIALRENRNGANAKAFCDIIIESKKFVEDGYIRVLNLSSLQAFTKQYIFKHKIDIPALTNAQPTNTQ